MTHCWITQLRKYPWEGNAAKCRGSDNGRKSRLQRREADCGRKKLTSGENRKLRTTPKPGGWNKETDRGKNEQTTTQKCSLGSSVNEIKGPHLGKC